MMRVALFCIFSRLGRFAFQLPQLTLMMLSLGDSLGDNCRGSG